MLPLRVRDPDRGARQLSALVGPHEKSCEAAKAEHRGLHAPTFVRQQPVRRGVEVKIISKLLGHASVEITYNRYIHFFEGDTDDTLRQADGT